MKIYKGIEEVKGIDFPVVTVGTFDGVHLGHQKIIDRLKEVARERGGETVVITFEPHPRSVVHPDSWNLKLINSPAKKTELLERTGIDHLVILPFTPEFASMTSYEFIRNILLDGINMKWIVVGFDHHFGKDRLGNHHSLRDFGQSLGFGVEEVAPMYIDGVAVSSSKIRNALNEGDIRKANRYLGYTYSIQGKVIPGYQVGRKIGFPTANIEVDDALKLITANGVYACRIQWKGREFDGMGNIGNRPTLNRNDHTVEVNIFDFDHEIYGDFLIIGWIDRIRNEIRFPDLEALRAQLEKDKDAAKNILQHLS
ncbi:MAG: bifunctional riboflavin kinase/FAD synthetase [Bacteroidales bacterium]|nr:bifunctional riboflavin kinase/FAD synthetase [Lentimicrobiaceae bacterium]MDD5694174.1 bifunctional riboflavin kinase/FAD synthetase [Bacteroidales bacterium]